MSTIFYSDGQLSRYKRELRGKNANVLKHENVMFLYGKKYNVGYL